MIMYIFRFLFLIVIINAEINPENIIVKITQGLIQGRLAKTVGKNQLYYAFQGVPYAEPPIGRYRFEVARPKLPWNGTLDATKDANECLQGNNPLEGCTNPVHGSEDCLYLNVYVPKNLQTQILPVMVNIHGGRFRGGNSSYILYGPDYFLEEGIIVVTLNYRLGIFGFLSTGDLVAPGNNGLKDQLLALKWVQENILKFGGDPKKVVLCGQGAGGAAVSYHMQSELSKGLFVGAIMQSGVSLCIRVLIRKYKFFNAKLADKLSLDISNSTVFVENLKKIDCKELQLLTWDFNNLGFIKNDPTEDIEYGPVLEPDHPKAFFSKNSYDVLSNKSFSKVPSIIGFTSFEMAKFPGVFLLPHLWYLLFDIENTKLVPSDLNVTQVQRQEVATILKSYYFSNMSITFSESTFKKFLNDKYFVRPIRDYVRLVYKQAPTYFYRFAYEGNLSNIIITNRTEAGAAHSEDIFYLWRRNYSTSASLQDAEIRQRMISWWTSFIKFLNPTPASGKYSPNDVVWRKVEDSSFTYLDINIKPEMKQNPEKENMALWDSLYERYGYRPYSTFLQNENNTQ